MVDGITVKYKNGEQGPHGGTGGGPNTFSLEDKEFITEVDVREGGVIQSLTFRTNKGKEYGPFGGKGGIFNKEGVMVTAKAPTGYRLIGIKGRAGKYLDAIGFRWGPMPEST